jgi:hypothetical protein
MMIIMPLLLTLLKTMTTTITMMIMRVATVMPSKFSTDLVHPLFELEDEVDLSVFLRLLAAQGVLLGQMCRQKAADVRGQVWGEDEVGQKVPLLTKFFHNLHGHYA